MRNKKFTHSLESRKKMTAVHLGVKLSIKHRQRISEGHRGEKHWNWKGGITQNKDYWNREYHREYRRKKRLEMGIIKKPKKSREKALTKREHRLLYKYNKKKAGELTIETIQLVYEDNIKQYGTLTCYLCLNSIPFRKDHLEHKTPLSRGGTNEYNNLAIACQRCNCKKHDKTEEEYRRILNHGKPK